MSKLKSISTVYARKLAQKFGYELLRMPKENLSRLKEFYPNESINCKRFYNIGAGGFSHPHWTNVDHHSEWYKYKLKDNVAIDWDLLELKPLGVDDGIAEAVYTSHTVEHITDEAVKNMFSEAYRILKPGGFLRVTTPDIDLDYRAYIENDLLYFYWFDNKRHSDPSLYPSARLNQPGKDMTSAQRFVFHLASSVSINHSDTNARTIDDGELKDIFNRMEYEAALDEVKGRASIDTQRKYPGNHINWWNENKLRRMLAEAGFDTVYRSGYGQSHCPAMRNTRYFDNTHPPISIYMEARK
ncbi:hypothetical protein GCM10009069_05350 [Algimonas arctica]|uniref:Methyltransferase type 11 domain-containing protein n=1 Tax=Algimonas arctica TaxID=1479486 RepID=A0A8J3CQ93_9PROT|nr:methyltransferase domain-containing protein [Algimonas arctica]GHA85161.1 hypothetical protein GCM10009069_05350 [Algimonas arctica]